MSKPPRPPVEEVYLPPSDHIPGVMKDTATVTRAAVNRDASDIRTSYSMTSNQMSRDNPISSPMSTSDSPVIPAIKVTGKTALTETEILDNIVYEILMETDSHLLAKANSLPEILLSEQECKEVEEEVYAILYKKYDELSEKSIRRTLPNLATNWIEGYDCLEVRKRLLGRGLNTKRGKIYIRHCEIMAARAQRKVEAEKFWRAHAHQLYTFTESFRPRLPMPRSHLAEIIDRNRAAYENSIVNYPGGPDGAFEFSSELPPDVLTESTYADKAEKFYEQLTADNNRLVEFNARRWKQIQQEIVLNKVRAGVTRAIDESMNELLSGARLDCYSEEEMLEWRQKVRDTLKSYRTTILSQLLEDL